MIAETGFRYLQQALTECRPLLSQNGKFPRLERMPLKACLLLSMALLEFAVALRSIRKYLTVCCLRLYVTSGA